MAAATLTPAVSDYVPIVDIVAAFERAGVADLDAVEFATRYLVGCPATVTFDEEICRRVDFVRRGDEDCEYVGTGCYESVETSGVITGFELDCRGEVVEVRLDPETRFDARTIDGDHFEAIAVAYNLFAGWAVA